MVISFTDIFDEALNQIIDKCLVNDGGTARLVLNGKARLIQRKVIELLNETAVGHSLLVFQKPEFKNSAGSFIWFDEKLLDEMYETIQRSVKKLMKNLKMSSRHIWEIIEVDVPYDDCIDVIIEIKKSSVTWKKEDLEYAQKQRHFLMRRSINEVKLEKERNAIKEYIASKTLL